MAQNVQMTSSTCYTNATKLQTSEFAINNKLAPCGTDGNSCNTI